MRFDSEQGKRGQLGSALSLANLGKMLQRLPEVRSLLMVVADCMKTQRFICVYDPEAAFPACSLTCVSWTDCFWGPIRLMSYCSIVRNKAPQIRIRRQLMSYALGLWLPEDKRRTLETQYLLQRGVRQRRSRLRKEAGGGRRRARTEVSPGVMPRHARRDSWAASLWKQFIFERRRLRPTWPPHAGYSSSAQASETPAKRQSSYCNEHAGPQYQTKQVSDCLSYQMWRFVGFFFLR